MGVGTKVPIGYFRLVGLDFSQLGFNNTLPVSPRGYSLAIDQTIDYLKTLALKPPICRWCFLSLVCTNVNIVCKWIHTRVVLASVYFLVKLKI